MLSLEKAMAPHSSTLAWKIPWMKEPGRLQSMGSLRVGHDWATSLSLWCTGEGNGNPLQCSCLENPRGSGAWWAAVYGVERSRTQLKWLSSSSSSRALSIRKPELNKLPWWIYRIFYMYVFSRGSAIVSIRFPRKSQLRKLTDYIIALNSVILRFCVLFLSTLLMSLSGNELSCQAQWPSKEQGYFYFKLETHA